MHRRFCSAVVAIVLFGAASASAQVVRNFPQNALRGEILFGEPPEVLLNRQETRLSPGSRIRGQDNLLVMSASLAGKRAIVNYTFDASGLVRDVWILRTEEIANRPWPVTIEQARAWEFDPAAQRWTQP